MTDAHPNRYQVTGGNVISLDGISIFDGLESGAHIAQGNYDHGDPVRARRVKRA